MRSRLAHLSKSKSVLVVLVTAVALALVGTTMGYAALTKDVTTAGRHPKSDLFLDDITVSRRHAEFVRGDQGFVLRDAGSLNGTYLNGERVDEAPLANGDEVQIGRYKLAFYANV